MDPRRTRSARPAEPGARRLAREAAMQMLYALDAAGGFAEPEVDAQIRAYWDHVDEVTRTDGRPYADRLVRGVSAAREGLDDELRAAQTKWRIERMARVDRTILRVGTLELRDAEVPAEVVIDEAIELAKTFGTEDSSAFVNGILERVAVRLGRLKR
jgi:N utilization substance protein B